MAGIGHRGFMGRKKGGLICGSPPLGFRFLHDEIPDGIVAFSHIQCKSTYNCENVVDVGTLVQDRISYPLASGFDDSANIAIDFPSSETTREYNQLNFSEEFGGGGSIWNGTNYSFNSLSGTSESINSNEPLTICFVLSGQNGTTQNYLVAQIGWIRLQWLSATSFIFQLNGGTFSRKTYTITRASDTKLLIATYDGSNSRSGLNLYINDMETPLFGVDGGNSATITAGQTATSYGLPIGLTSGLVWCPERHVFRRELSQTEREDVKEILEQKYIFS